MKTKTLQLATSVLATSLVAMGGDIDWKSTMVIAECQRVQRGNFFRFSPRRDGPPRDAVSTR